MTGRLLLCVAFVAHILILVACKETAQASATSASSARGTSSSSYASSSSSAKTVVKSKPKSCTETAQATATSASSASGPSSSSNASSSSSAKTVVKSKPKCRRVGKCPKNEEYSSNPESIQRAQYCSEKAEVASSRSKPCKGGCVCKKNYLRAENGTCIPAAECPVTCGANEVLDNCPTDCQSDYCPTEDDTGAKPCVVPDVCPPPACKCAFNYRRACNGSCIPTRECPPYACGTNEEYNPCPPLCPTDDCSQASPSGECPPHIGRIGIILPCNPKCRCIKGYWRLDGICVPYGQCPGVCPANERYSTCIQAECRALNCTQKGQPVPCVEIDQQYCEKGCVCEEGYLRNEDGICVLEDKCEPEVCPANERYSTCIQAECRALNCTQKGQPVPCIRLDPQCCEKGCVCEEGYLRNEDGICVLEEKCEHEVCPANERYSTCIQAECRALNCTQKGQPVPCIRLDPQCCEKGCVCEEGYLRNEDGICVLEDKCEPEPSCCSPNEEFVSCMQGVCRAQNCTQKGEDVPCPDIPQEQCDSGCICKEHFLRAANGSCVPEDQCEPPLTCGENEVLDKCPMICNTDNCPQSADEKQVCTQADPCVPACKCRFNYKRAENGTCIPTRDCPPFDCSAKPNEEYVACPPLCPTDECGKPRLEGRCPYRIGIILQCNPKCQCKDGYGRANGTCVPFEECPGLCPTNEEYSSCVQQTCRQQKCSDRDLAMETCPSCDEASCQRGCVCQENYYRNDKGVCVSYEECGGPLCPNAHEEYIPDFKECPPNICNSLVTKYACDENQKVGPGCVCKSGYLRLDLTSPCIPICDCPEMKDSPEC